MPDFVTDLWFRIWKDFCGDCLFAITGLSGYLWKGIGRLGWLQLVKVFSRHLRRLWLLLSTAIISLDAFKTLDFFFLLLLSRLSKWLGRYSSNSNSRRSHSNCNKALDANPPNPLTSSKTYRYRQCVVILRHSYLFIETSLPGSLALRSIQFKQNEVILCNSFQNTCVRDTIRKQEIRIVSATFSVMNSQASPLSFHTPTCTYTHIEH